MTKTAHPNNSYDKDSINQAIVTCTLCPRLVDWRETVAKDKVKRFMDWDYWGKAVPSFGSLDAEVLIVGLAPAAHGANRTGRMFTGDRSGDWLYGALYKAGFCNQPESISIDDGLNLNNVRITAACHCAPPANKPTKEEISHCRPYLVDEFNVMKNLKVILCLGKISFDMVLGVLNNDILPKEQQLKPKPAFGHNQSVPLPNGMVLVGSYHPSQQNTFTGRLTEPMFDSVFENINQLLK